MAFYDCETNRIIYFKPRNSQRYPGWEIIDCGCSYGLQWGGEEPIECNRCNATGTLWRHKESGVLAEYPGGKFKGRD